MILDSVVLFFGCSIVESSDRTHFAIPITVAYLGLLIISITPFIESGIPILTLNSNTSSANSIIFFNLL